MELHEVKSDKRIVVYRAYVMAVNKLSYVMTQVVKFTVPR